MDRSMTGVKRFTQRLKVNANLYERHHFVNECSGSRIRWACSRIRLDERLFGRAHRPL